MDSDIGERPERPTRTRAARRAVPGHNRPKAWRSIRVRIMAPVLIAVVGVIALGSVLAGDALRVANEADRASTLAKAAGTIGSLAHEVAFEYVQTNEAKRPGRSRTIVDEQRLVTDAAAARFAEANRAIRTVAPDLLQLSNGADQALGSLDYAREVARESPDGSAEVRAYYDQILTSLLALADALPAQMSDTALIELSRSVVLTAELDRLAALQLDLITRGLTMRELQPGDTIQLAEWSGRERSYVDSLTNLRPAADRYGDLVSRIPVTQARAIRQVILDGRGSTASLAATDPLTWYRAQLQRVDGLHAMAAELAKLLDAEATAVGTAARERTYLIGGLAAVVVAVTLSGAAVMAVRTSRRLRRTRYAALAAARIELPTAIANVTSARDAATVRAALNDSSDRVEAMLAPGPDEIGELATAFGAVHRQALRLAADQALLRMEVQAMFVALSRRGQTLIQRQIHLIDEFGRNEADPDALSRLFALDHLAARMRRNEENLLVLAGGEPARWITRPVSVVDLVRAAAQETEEYPRVSITETADLSVTAHVAGDVIHLLAELLENATTFSPPNTNVQVSARHATRGLIITIADDGIGMPPRHLAEANDRLTRPSALTSTLVGTMGLLVVARLAQRHGIEVRLQSVPAGGTTASVLLPEGVLTHASAQEQLQPGRWLREIESAQHDPPAPAATTLPTVLRPAGSAAAASNAETPTPAGAGEPSMQTGSAPEATTSAVSTPLAQHTAAGLPRRPPEHLPADAGMNGSGYDAGRTLPGRMPDPETVRARLSSLASGLAAANARPEPPEQSGAQTESWRDPSPPPAVPRPQ